MSKFLPLRCRLEWLKKTAKDRLAELRPSDPEAKLNEVQLELAREYGFSSWKALVAHVETVRAQLLAAFPVLSTFPIPKEDVAPTDPDVAKLLSSIRAGDVAAVMGWLAKRPALANAYGPGGKAALHVAAECNDARLAIVLLAHDADPLATIHDSHHDALSWAVTCNGQDAARALVRLAVFPDLFSAAGAGMLPEVQSFFDAEGNLKPNASRTGSSCRTADGTSLSCPPLTVQDQISDAISIAARNGQTEVVRFLLTKQPDLTFRSFLGATALHWAYFSGSGETIDLLQAAGADSTSVDEYFHCVPGQFGICAAASWGLLFRVEALVQANPQLVGVYGATSALHEAAASGHSHVAKFLLDRGADPQVRDARGRTPLDRAVESQRPEVAELLRQTAQARHES